MPFRLFININNLFSEKIFLSDSESSGYMFTWSSFNLTLHLISSHYFIHASTATEEWNCGTFITDTGSGSSVPGNSETESSVSLLLGVYTQQQLINLHVTLMSGLKTVWPCFSSALEVWSPRLAVALTFVVYTSVVISDGRPQGLRHPDTESEVGGGRQNHTVFQLSCLSLLETLEANKRFEWGENWASERRFPSRAGPVEISFAQKDHYCLQKCNMMLL